MIFLHLRLTHHQNYDSLIITSEEILDNIKAYCGWDIPPDYDSLIAKVVTLAPNRTEAISKMKTALETTTIVGIKTNIPLHLELLSNTEFVQGDYDIQFMENYLKKDADRNAKN